MLLAIDPGIQKCGLAVVTDQVTVIKKMVIPSPDLIEVVTKLNHEFRLAMVVVGDRTSSKRVREKLISLNIPIIMVDEHKSSLEGRYRYLRENTKGLVRFIPIGLRVPKEPYDDYVAVILAERFLKQHHSLNNKS